MLEPSVLIEKVPERKQAERRIVGFCPSCTSSQFDCNCPFHGLCGNEPGPNAKIQHLSGGMQFSKQTINMADSSNAPQQYKQPSRKGKQAWRKNVNITQVQAGLESARDELRGGYTRPNQNFKPLAYTSGSGIITERPSNALFTIDPKPSAVIQKDVARFLKLLKADQILAQRSAMPAMGTHTKTRPVAKKQRIGGVCAQEYARLQACASGSDAAGSDSNIGPQNDIWDHQQPHSVRSRSFVDELPSIRVPDTLKQPSISLLKSGRALSAVPQPQAATSYNPAFDDWDKSLSMEGAKEVLAEHRRRRQAREDEERQARVKMASSETDHPPSDDESVWKGIESEFEDLEWRKKRPTRKTPAERNKIRRKKAAERHAKHQARMKARGMRIEVSREPQPLSSLVTPVSLSESDINDTALRAQKLGTTR